jgi:hypothetical protein
MFALGSPSSQRGTQETGGRWLSSHIGMVRAAAVALAAATTALYAVVGLAVVDISNKAENGPIVPLVMTAFVFAALTVLLALRPRRVSYLTGAALCAVAIVGYFVIAPSRDPSFEAWGLSIKVVQVVLLAALAWLARRAAGQAPALS